MDMLLVVWLGGVAVAVAILLLATWWGQFARVGSELAGGLLIATFPLAIIAPFPLWITVAAIVVHIWLLVLPARLAFGRLEPLFLRHSTRSNAVVGLVLLGLLVTAGTLLPTWLAQPGIVVWLTVALCAAIYCLGQLIWNTRHYALRTAPLAMQDTPTVSVCIPARNEDHALADCLTAVLGSTYPKLEVIVLDDCSQDATSTIIKSFAHDGVRFVQGEQPAVGWLGKNQAMETLAQHASGDFILFLDVDTHVAPQSITQLMQYVRANGIKMASVLPQQRAGLAPNTAFGTLDYFWRMALPITGRRMPVSSKSWLIERASLQKLGGFSSVSRKIMPEESFARRLSAQKAYRFLVSNAALGFTTAKRWTSQIETGLRLSYPQLRRQPLRALGQCVLIVALCAAPIAIAVFGLVAGQYTIVSWLALAAAVLLLVDYCIVLIRTQPKSWVATGLLWPFALAQETVLIIASMLLYEFDDVNWKGRNVCYPVVALPRREQTERILRRHR